MSHTVESGASSSARARRRRTGITIVLLVLALFLAFWYAYSYYRGRGSPPPQVAATPCPSVTASASVKAVLSPNNITVNVYNATSRSGLAATTAKAVRARGFTVSTVTNDPLKKTVTAPAEVRYGKSGAAAARQVAALVKGVKLLRDGRQDSSVDLVLGNGFKALAPAAKPSQPTPPASC